jgi:hypothetical protein
MMEKKSKCGDVMSENEKKATIERFVFVYGWDAQVACKVFNFLYDASLTPDLLIWILEREGTPMTD